MKISKEKEQRNYKEGHAGTGVGNTKALNVLIDSGYQFLDSSGEYSNYNLKTTVLEPGIINGRFLMLQDVHQGDPGELIIDGIDEHIIGQAEISRRIGRSDGREKTNLLKTMRSCTFPDFVCQTPEGEIVAFELKTPSADTNKGNLFGYFQTNKKAISKELAGRHQKMQGVIKQHILLVDLNSTNVNLEAGISQMHQVFTANPEWAGYVTGVQFIVNGGNLSPLYKTKDLAAHAKAANKKSGKDFFKSHSTSDNSTVDAANTSATSLLTFDDEDVPDFTDTAVDLSNTSNNMGTSHAGNALDVAQISSLSANTTHSSNLVPTYPSISFKQGNQPTTTTTKKTQRKSDGRSNSASTKQRKTATGKVATGPLDAFFKKTSTVPSGNNTVDQQGFHTNTLSPTPNTTTTNMTFNSPLVSSSQTIGGMYGGLGNRSATTLKAPATSQQLKTPQIPIGSTTNTAKISNTPALSTMPSVAMTQEQMYRSMGRNKPVHSATQSQQPVNLPTNNSSFGAPKITRAPSQFNRMSHTTTGSNFSLSPQPNVTNTNVNNAGIATTNMMHTTVPTQTTVANPSTGGIRQHNWANEGIHNQLEANIKSEKEMHEDNQDNQNLDM